jgi:hypothetical protein
MTPTLLNDLNEVLMAFPQSGSDKDARRRLVEIFMKMLQPHGTLKAQEVIFQMTENVVRQMERFGIPLSELESPTSPVPMLNCMDYLLRAIIKRRSFKLQDPLVVRNAWNRISNLKSRMRPFLVRVDKEWLPKTFRFLEKCPPVMGEDVSFSESDTDGFSSDADSDTSSSDTNSDTSSSDTDSDISSSDTDQTTLFSQANTGTSPSDANVCFS